VALWRPSPAHRAVLLRSLRIRKFSIVNLKFNELSVADDRADEQSDAEADDPARDGPEYRLLTRGE
jgi:hypothetical protein